MFACIRMITKHPHPAAEKTQTTCNLSKTSVDTVPRAKTSSKQTHAVYPMKPVP